jgi:hypothetical protein
MSLLQTECAHSAASRGASHAGNAKKSGLPRMQPGQRIGIDFEGEMAANQPLPGTPQHDCLPGFGETHKTADQLELTRVLRF